MEKNGYITENINNKTLKKRISINMNRKATIIKRASKSLKRKSMHHAPIKKRKSMKVNENNNQEKRKSVKAKSFNNNQGNENISERKSIKSITMKDNQGNTSKIKRKSKRYTINKLKLNGNSFVNNLKLTSGREDKNMKDSSNKGSDVSQHELKNINIMETKILQKSKEKEKENDNNFINLNLININLNNVKDYIPKHSMHILNNYNFEEAIQYDMRSICAIFYIFLLSKEPLCHAFLFRSPLELFPLRLCLLLFIISSDLALNALFYLDDKISEKYKYAKNLFLFTFNNNITIILLSTLIGFIFMTLFTNLSNSTNSIIDVFR